MRAHLRGASLLELIVSMAIFGLIMSMVFLLFGIGSRGFRTVEGQQGVHNQLAAIRASLQQDLQQTHFYGIFSSEYARNLHGISHPRHIFSTVAVSDWNASGAVNDYGLPLWDRWVVYRVTNTDSGELVRQLVKPRSGKGRLLLRPADRLEEMASLDQVVTPWGGDVSPNILARGVRALRLERHDAQRAVTVEVTLEQKADYESAKPEVVTASFYIKPHNTVPVD